MALTLLQIVEGEKSFKGKSIAEIAYSFWILDISPSLKDGEWTFSVEMFMKMMKEEVVKSMTFIIHSKNVDNKEQEAIEFKETYDFDILLRRFRMNWFRFSV